MNKGKKMKNTLLVLALIFIISCGDDSSVVDDDVETSGDLDAIEILEDDFSINDEGSQFDENEEVLDADEAVINDEIADEEETDEDQVIEPECSQNEKEALDCEVSGKKIRICENGSWGEFSDCIDINSEVSDIASSSQCASFYWADRGNAPEAYMKGMGLVFAGALCNKDRSDVVLVSSAKSTDLTHDVLAWYDDINIFSDLGMSNDVDGLDTLQHAYTLLTGLGMRESSGEHCCGRDTSATNTTADTAEAGLFQTSYNSHVFSAELDTLYAYWKDVKTLNPEKCLLNVFSEDVTCSASNWENFGTGEGLFFQALEKECPAFAAEYAAVMLRVSGGSGGHYGPLRRREAQVRVECNTMLNEIRLLIETNPLFCEFLTNY